MVGFDDGDLESSLSNNLFLEVSVWLMSALAFHLCCLCKSWIICCIKGWIWSWLRVLVTRDLKMGIPRKINKKRIANGWIRGWQQDLRPEGSQLGGYRRWGAQFWRFPCWPLDVLTDEDDVCRVPETEHTATVSSYGTHISPLDSPNLGTKWLKHGQRPY